MSEQNNTNRPAFLRTQPTAAGATLGLVLFSTYASIFTPLAFLKTLKNVFGGNANPLPKDPNGLEKPVEETIVSDWELKNIVYPMINISHINLRWSDGTIPNTVFFKTHDLNILHARAEAVNINAHLTDQDKKIAILYMTYFTSDGRRKEDTNVYVLPLKENKLD